MILLGTPFNCGIPGNSFDCCTPWQYILIAIVVLANCPFDFDTRAKVKINIITRECSPGPRNPSKKKMIWNEESRAEMAFGRIDQDWCDSEARSKLSYPTIR